MKQLKSLNPNVKAILVVVGVLLASAIAYFAVVRPEAAKVNRIKADEASAQSKLDAYKHSALSARSAPKIEFADVYRLAKAMPSTTDMPDVLLELGQLARDTGITFTNIQPQSLIAMGSYSVQPISLTFAGNFYDLADLLYRLRSLVNVHEGRLGATGRLFSVDTLTFDEGDGGFPQIKATLTVDAFVYGTAGATASPDATAAASSTTTTSTTTTTPTTTTPTTPTASASSAAGGH